MNGIKRTTNNQEYVGIQVGDHMTIRLADSKFKRELPLYLMLLPGSILVLIFL